MGRPSSQRPPRHIKPKAGAEAETRRVLALLDGEPILAPPPPPVWNARQGERKFHVSNLSYDCTEDDLRSIFTPLGRIVELHVFRDAYTSKSRGFACLRLVGADARTLHNHMFMGRELRIDLWDRE
jgi:hypothetical protein